MITAAHHTMLMTHCPKVFNHIAVKIIASRVNQGSSAGWSYMTGNTFNTSIGDIQFINSSDGVYSFPSTTTIASYTCFDRTRFVSEPLVLSNSSFHNLFLGTTPTSGKTASINLQSSVGYRRNEASVLYYESGKILADKTKLVSSEDWASFFKGNKASAMGCSLVLNVSQSPLDVSTYSRWRFYHGDDSIGQSRFWCEGEILGSVDGITWYRMDRFNDTTAGGNTKLALARTAELIPTQGGDLFQDIDYMSRDWKNGIQV